MSKSMLTSFLPDNVKFFPATADDFLSLDKSRQIKVIKALWKLSRNPTSLGRFWKMDLTGRFLDSGASMWTRNPSVSYGKLQIPT